MGSLLGNLVSQTSLFAGGYFSKLRTCLSRLHFLYLVIYFLSFFYIIILLNFFIKTKHVVLLEVASLGVCILLYGSHMCWYVKIIQLLWRKLG